MISNTKEKVETIMTGDNKHGDALLGSFLSMVSKVYGGAVKLRQQFYQWGVAKSRRLPCTVISVGNLSVGGTGKTPLTIYLADLIKNLGYKVAVVSRGYKGRSEKAGGIVSDGGALMTDSRIAGDEPYMMAAKLKDVPVIVGKNRYEAGMLAVREYDPDVLVLDDAFQHLKLRRDLDLVLLDYRRPFGNGQLLPRGIMREPISALSRADALIFTRSDAQSDSETSSCYSKFRRYLVEKPMFKAYHIPYVHKVVRGEKSIFDGNSERSLTWDSEDFKGRSAVVFSGLANNRNFHGILKGLKCIVKSSLEFPDHHFYSDTDIQSITESAKKSRAEFLITTEKDFVRIADIIKWPVDLVVVGIEVSLGPDADSFSTFIQSRLHHQNLGSRL